METRSNEELYKEIVQSAYDKLFGDNPQPTSDELRMGITMFLYGAAEHAEFAGNQELANALTNEADQIKEVLVAFKNKPDAQELTNAISSSKHTCSCCG